MGGKAASAPLPAPRRTLGPVARLAAGSPPRGEPAPRLVAAGTAARPCALRALCPGTTLCGRTRGPVAPRSLALRPVGARGAGLAGKALILAAAGRAGGAIPERPIAVPLLSPGPGLAVAARPLAASSLGFAPARVALALALEAALGRPRSTLAVSEAAPVGTVRARAGRLAVVAAARAAVVPALEAAGSALGPMTALEPALAGLALEVAAFAARLALEALAAGRPRLARPCGPRLAFCALGVPAGRPRLALEALALGVRRPGPALGPLGVTARGARLPVAALGA